MLVKNARYELTAVKPEQYPANTLPEIAFVGRSNVGKSSIINALVNRKNLARVGGTPGKTRQINFYNLDDTLYFVDLPGYGYAKVSKEEKETWGSFIETYLSTRNQLKLVILLIDIRHAPTKDDQLMAEWMVSSQVPFLVVATKLDKIKRSQIAKQISEIKKVLALAPDAKPIPFSSQTKQGKDELWEVIDGFILDHGQN